MNSVEPRLLAVRPSIPRLFPCCVLAWTACSLFSTMYVSSYTDGMFDVSVFRVHSLLCAVLGMGVGLICLRIYSARRRFIWCLVAVWTASTLSAGLLYLQCGQNSGVLSASDPASYQFIVQSDPRAFSWGGYYFSADAFIPTMPQKRYKVLVSVTKGSLAEAPAMGAIIELTGDWDAFDESSDYDKSMLKQGYTIGINANGLRVVGWSGGLVGSIRLLRSRLLEMLLPLESDRSALLCAVVLGDQAAVAYRGISDTFSKLGLSHLVAVSGSHLAVVSTLISALLGCTRARPRLRVSILATLLGVYVCLTGFQISAIRSCVMVLCSLFGGLAGRRSQSLSSLCAAVLGMVLLRPASVCTLSLQLSALSVASLVIFGTYVCGWIRCLPVLGRFEGLCSALSVTLVAQVATLPITLPIYGVIPLYCVPANLCMAPLIGLILILALPAAALVLLAPQAGFLFGIPLFLAGCGCSVSEWMGGFSLCAPVVNISGFAACSAALLCATAVYLFWPSPSRKRLLCLVCVLGTCLSAYVLYWRLFAPARIVVLDIGQGDAILIQEGSYAVLFDTGPDDAILDALARQHVWHLDAVVLTHTDLDHTGGLDELAGHVNVDAVVLASGTRAALLQDESWIYTVVQDDLKTSFVEVTAGSRMQVGSFEIEFVWPQTEVDGADNEDCLVALARYVGSNAFSVLLCADAESPIIEKLIQEDMLDHADVLKVAHHGSSASVSSSMLDVLQCELAVASASENNSYGHPSQVCIDTCLDAGVMFLCTKDTGDITIKASQGGIKVSYYSDTILLDTISRDGA